MIWQEEAPGGYPGRELLALSGTERQRAGREGRIPHAPIGYLTEMRMTESSRGHSTFTMPASPWFANSAGLIPGGVLALLGDAALGSVVFGDLPPGQMMTTAELSLSFLRPLVPRPGREMSGYGQLIHRGRRMGLSEAFLLGPDDALIAHGTSRCSVLPPIEPMPERLEEIPVLDQPLPGSDPRHPLRRDLRGEILPQEVFAGRSGLEVLNGVIAGELPAPPIRHLTGLRAVSASEGEAVMALPCSTWLSTLAGTVQGGFTAMLAEAALGSAIFSTAPAGTATATVDLKVNYLRPVFPDGEELMARAKVIHGGKTIAVASAELTNAEGKPVALATGSGMYLPGREARLTGVEQLGGSD